MRPLADALAAAMDERDWTPADLARATGIKESTIRGFTSGRVALPHGEQRNALDHTLGGDVRGTTRRICVGELDPPRYPSEPLARVCRAAQRLPVDVLVPLAELLERLS